MNAHSARIDRLQKLEADGQAREQLITIDPEQSVNVEG